MKSNKQKRIAIQQKRARRTQTLQEQLAETCGDENARRRVLERALREGVVALADQAILAAHNNTDEGFLPRFYADLACTCNTCGAAYVWTAKQQKWWYEVAHGPIYSGASGCADCRRQRRLTKAADPFHQSAVQLRTLAQANPDADARAVVEEALASKWHGLRVIAIDVLGAWWGRTRDPADLLRLRSWADHAVDGVHSDWSALAAHAAAKAIAAHLRAADMAWALPELLLERPAADNRVEHIVDAMPQATLLHALTASTWMSAAHTDATLAPKLLRILARINQRTVGWEPLAKHYMASPVIGQKARHQLHWRVSHSVPKGGKA